MGAGLYYVAEGIVHQSGFPWAWPVLTPSFSVP